MFSFLKTKASTSGLTALAVGQEGVFLARAGLAAGRRPQVSAWDFRPWGGDSQVKVLSRLCSDYGLKQARCTTVLNHGEYQLLLTEAPDVKADELKAAVRWRIKDLIDIHINDATIDVFELPGTSPGAPRYMYAVVASNQAIQQRVDLMDAAGINLEIIDVPELAQRNLASLLEEDARGVLLLSLHDTGGVITITRQGEIYLTRAVDVGLGALQQGGDPNAYFDRIVLEVQRSIDYFDSHFRQAAIAQLALAPLPFEIPGLLAHLNANLNIKASAVDLGALLDFSRPMPAEMQSRSLNALGAALRQESAVL